MTSPGPSRGLFKEIRDVLAQDVLPVATLCDDAAVSLFETYLRINNSREFKDRVAVLDQATARCVENFYHCFHVGAGGSSPARC